MSTDGGSDSTPNRKLGLDDAYAVETPEDNIALYRDWADSYESDFIAPRGYVYHQRVAELFAAPPAALGAPDTPWPSDAAVLDVGCGTGLVGASLRSLGCGVIDGLDLSEEMMAVAATKRTADGDKVYRAFHQADLTQTLDHPDAAWAGLVSAGTFTHGHVGPEALDELVRIVAPGGRFALGINAEHFEGHGFAAAFERLTAAGRITPPVIEEVRMYEAGPGTDSADDEHADDVAKVVLFNRADGTS